MRAGGTLRYLSCLMQMIDGMVYIMVLILHGNLDIGAPGWNSPLFDLFNANNKWYGLYHGTYISW